MVPKFLAIAAHADDFELFPSCACTLGEVQVFIVTHPDITRRQELEEASKIFGYSYQVGVVPDGYMWEWDQRSIS